MLDLTRRPLLRGLAAPGSFTKAARAPARTRPMSHQPARPGRGGGARAGCDLRLEVSAPQHARAAG